MTTSPAELRDACVGAVSAALDEIASAGREPDLWERVHLASSISDLFRGAYRLGLIQANKVCVPAAERSPNPNLPDDPLYERCDLALLRAALDEAKREPVREWPHWGPVVFSGSPPP